MIFPGWTIENVIPYKCIAGLLTGEYSLTGGVIRFAEGTAKGGQIVAHLLPAASNLLPGFNFIPGLFRLFANSLPYTFMRPLASHLLQGYNYLILKIKEV